MALPATTGRQIRAFSALSFLSLLLWLQLVAVMVPSLLLHRSVVVVDGRTTFRPLRVNEPRPVLVNLVAQEFMDIDDAGQTFTSDFYLVLYYQIPGLDEFYTFGNDPSSTANAAVMEVLHRQIGEGQALDVELKSAVDASQTYETLWAVLDAPPATNDFAVVASNASWPWVEMDMRFRGTFRSQFDLRSFPRDTQPLIISFEFVRHPSNEYYLQGAVDRGILGVQPFTPTGFILTDGSFRIEDVFYPDFNLSFSRYEGKVYIKRQAAAVYGVRIVATLLITTLMTFFLYVFPIGDTGRHWNSAMLFLASVTYMLTIKSDLPKVPYTTRLDNFILISLLNNLTCYAWFSVAFWAREGKRGTPILTEARRKLPKYDIWTCVALMMIYIVVSLVSGFVNMPYYGPIAVYVPLNLATHIGIFIFVRCNRDHGRTESYYNILDLPLPRPAPGPHCALCCPHSPPGGAAGGLAGFAAANAPFAAADAEVARRHHAGGEAAPPPPTAEQATAKRSGTDLSVISSNSEHEGPARTRTRASTSSTAMVSPPLPSEPIDTAPNQSGAVEHQVEHRLTTKTVSWHASIGTSSTIIAEQLQPQVKRENKKGRKVRSEGSVIIESMEDDALTRDTPDCKNPPMAIHTDPHADTENGTPTLAPPRGQVFAAPPLQTSASIQPNND